MNGIHDMGGMDGFGPIVRVADEPVFSTEWERRTFGVLVVVACNGHFVFDECRSAIENMGNTKYMNTSYYEHWLAGFEIILRQKGLLTDEEINARKHQLLKEGGYNA